MGWFIKNFKDLIFEKQKKFSSRCLRTTFWSIKAVFLSWESKRAKTYRKFNHIPGELGYSSKCSINGFWKHGNDCATGVAFTRNPSTGENKFFGEYLINAQGEDVVAGSRTPRYITKKAKEDAGAKEDRWKRQCPKFLKN